VPGLLNRVGGRREGWVQEKAGREEEQEMEEEEEEEEKEEEVRG